MNVNRYAPSRMATNRATTHRPRYQPPSSQPPHTVVVEPEGVPWTASNIPTALHVQDIPSGAGGPFVGTHHSGGAQHHHYLVQNMIRQAQLRSGVGGSTASPAPCTEEVSRGMPSCRGRRRNVVARPKPGQMGSGVLSNEVGVWRAAGLKVSESAAGRVDESVDIGAQANPTGIYPVLAISRQHPALHGPMLPQSMFRRFQASVSASSGGIPLPPARSVSSTSLAVQGASNQYIPQRVVESRVTTGDSAGCAYSNDVFARIPPASKFAGYTTNLQNCGEIRPRLTADFSENVLSNSTKEDDVIATDVPELTAAGHHLRACRTSSESGCLGRVRNRSEAELDSDRMHGNKQRQGNGPLQTAHAQTGQYKRHNCQRSARFCVRSPHADAAATSLPDETSLKEPESIDEAERASPLPRSEAARHSIDNQPPLAPEISGSADAQLDLDREIGLAQRRLDKANATPDEGDMEGIGADLGNTTSAPEVAPMHSDFWLAGVDWMNSGVANRDSTPPVPLLQVLKSDRGEGGDGSSFFLAEQEVPADLIDGLGGEQVNEVEALHEQGMVVSRSTFPPTIKSRVCTGKATSPTIPSRHRSRDTRGRVEATPRGLSPCSPRERRLPVSPKRRGRQVGLVSSRHPDVEDQVHIEYVETSTTCARRRRAWDCKTTYPPPEVDACGRRTPPNTFYESSKPRENVLAGSGSLIGVSNASIPRSSASRERNSTLQGMRLEHGRTEARVSSTDFGRTATLVKEHQRSTDGGMQWKGWAARVRKDVEKPRQANTSPPSRFIASVSRQSPDCTAVTTQSVALNDSCTRSAAKLRECSSFPVGRGTMVGGLQSMGFTVEKSREPLPSPFIGIAPMIPPCRSAERNAPLSRGAVATSNSISPASSTAWTGSLHSLDTAAIFEPKVTPFLAVCQEHRPPAGQILRQMRSRAQFSSPSPSPPPALGPRHLLSSSKSPQGKLQDVTETSYSASERSPSARYGGWNHDPPQFSASHSQIPTQPISASSSTPLNLGYRRQQDLLAGSELDIREESVLTVRRRRKWDVGPGADDDSISSPSSPPASGPCLGLPMYGSLRPWADLSNGVEHQSRPTEGSIVPIRESLRGASDVAECEAKVDSDFEGDGGVTRVRLGWREENRAGGELLYGEACCEVQGCHARWRWSYDSSSPRAVTRGALPARCCTLHKLDGMVEPRNVQQGAVEEKAEETADSPTLRRSKRHRTGPPE